MDWQFIIPTVFTTGSEITGSNKIVMDFDLVDTIISGSLDTSVAATLSGTFKDDNKYIVDDFQINNAINGSNDIIIGVTSGQLSVVRFNDVKNNFEIISIIDDRFINIPMRFYSTTDLVGFANDIPTKFKIYISGINDGSIIPIDLTISNSKIFHLDSDIFSSEIINKYLDTDINVEKGRVSLIASDLFCCSGTQSTINSDIFCSLYKIDNYISSVTTASGNLHFITSDIYSTGLSELVDSVACDVRTWSLRIGDFFLDVDEFKDDFSTAWVDIYDDFGTVVSGNSYFLVDGQRVDVTFSDITNGYKMFYNPQDDFYSTGILTYTVHVENNFNDVLEKDYYLLHGYNLQFADFVKWPVNKVIPILTKATNEVFCPNTSTDAFYFKTRDLESYDLNASIRAVEYVDLNVCIYPQNTFWFYDRTYTITINGIRDFEGNEMSKFSYTFKIENPNA